MVGRGLAKTKTLSPKAGFVRGEIRLVGYGSRLSLEIKVGHMNVKIIHEVISFKLIRPYWTSQIMRIEKKVILKPRGKMSSEGMGYHAVLS